MAWDPTKALAEQDGAGIIAGTQRGKQRLPDSDMIYQTSKWGRYLWREFSGQSPEASNLQEKGTETLPRWPAYMRELFTRFYAENPQPVEDVDPSHGWAQQAHQQAEELPEFARLRDRCMGDKLWSGLAATSIGDEVLRALPEPEDPIEDTRPMERRVQGLEGLKAAGVPVDAELQQAQATLQKTQQAAQQYGQQLDPSKIRQALRRGVDVAQKTIDEAQSTASAFGWDLSDGDNGTGGDIESKRQIYSKVKNSKKLRALVDLAGRMRRFASQKQRSKADHARDEISDVTLGADLSRLLPSEAAKLRYAKALFVKDLNERKLLCYELKGKEPQQKGPIIVLVDNSGSMSGQPELWSKAVALAMLDIAKRQQRSFAVVHFDTSVRCSMIWEKGPNPPEWQKVVEVMEFFSGGGTKFKPPLEKALSIIETEGFQKADVILVTDGAASTDFAERYRHRATAKEVTTYGIQIGGSRSGEAVLGQFCDHAMTISDLDVANPVTETLFSI